MPDAWKFEEKHKAACLNVSMKTFVGIDPSTIYESERQ